MILKEQEQKTVYSDGETVEKEMLDIAKAYPEDLSQDYIAQVSKYTVNNTFSSVRRNILNWYPFKKDADILEVGAGMGSITGLLCDVAKSVTSIEMSEARANVIRARYPERKNLTIISEDINHWETEQKFDYIVFIGVLEYAAVFSDADNPFEQFLVNVKNLLKPNGVVLFAIENKFGLKYWAGGSEDHLQKPYVGIEGYKEKKTPRTFSKAELKELLNLTGLSYNRFYYVLPDYKFPEMICTDDYLPDYTALEKLSYTYSKNSILAFNEKDVYKEILANGVLDFFANSYLIEASSCLLEDNYIAYVSARSEVRKPYRVFTLIDKNTQVSKVAMHKEAQQHVLNIHKYAEDLKSKGIRILEGKLVDGKYISEFYYGESAQDRFADLLRANGIEGIHELIGLLKENLLKSSDISEKSTSIIDEAGVRSLMEQKEQIVLSNGYIDMTFYNAFIDADGLIFYDQEWCYENVPLEFILYYAVKSSYNRTKAETKLLLNQILDNEKLLGFVTAFDKLEEYVWSKVLYRQGDLYGEDGYCNRYDADDSLQMILIKRKQQAQQLEQAQEQLEHTEQNLRQTQGQLEETHENLRQVQEQRENLKLQCDNKEGHIQLLLQSERDLQNEITAMKNSRTWRVACIMHKPITWILPAGSKRRLFAKMFFKFLRHPLRSIRHLTPGRIRNLFMFLREEGTDFVSNRIDESLAYSEEKEIELNLQPIFQDKSFEEYDRLDFKKESNPKVSIIIPVYNQFVYTYHCLESILHNTGDKISYEIIIANDCSTDDTKRLGEIAGNIRIITNKENLKFLKNCNHAAEFANGKYILFLNNDTQVQENWLEPLVNLLEEDESIGMTGSKLIYANGKLQEAGGIIWQDASAWNYGNGKNPTDPEFNYVKEVDYISGASIIIRASLWKEIGGFDERYVPAYCEDSDLAFEVRKHGYRVVYQPLSVVVHFEGISNGTDINSGIKQYQVKNNEKLKEKWNKELEELFPNGKNIFQARERSKDKKIIVFIDHYVPHFDEDAGSKTIYQYLQMFVKKGYIVKFIGDNFFQHEPYTTILQQLGIEVLYGPYYAKHVLDWIRKNAKQIDYIFLNRPHISIKYIDTICDETDIKTIYYGHDLHFLRNRREYELTGDEKKKKDSEDWLKKELYLMRKADISYYPSFIEEEEIHKIDPAISVKAITAYVYDQFKDNIEYDFSKREGILFVGGFNHDPNTDAVLWFVQEIWPLIHEKIDAVFYIVGSHARKNVKELDGEKGIVVKGFISDEELEQLYATCKMTVVPLRYGAGVKGKVVDALYNGMPLVTTSVGAEGIPGIEDAAVIEDEPERFAEQVVNFYQDNEKLKALAEKTQKLVKAQFSTEAVWDIIKDDFGYKGD